MLCERFDVCPRLYERQARSKSVQDLNAPLNGGANVWEQKSVLVFSRAIIKLHKQAPGKWSIRIEIIEGSVYCISYVVSTLLLFFSHRKNLQSVRRCMFEDSTFISLKCRCS